MDKDISNAIRISKDNLAIKRILDKCINCGICKQTCKYYEGMEFNLNSELCVNCGGCVATCPVNSILPIYDIDKFIEAKKNGKITIAYTSPSVRVAFGDIFGLEPGIFVQEKVVGFLKKLGFDYVFDTTFAADLTIMEEASELVKRIKNNNKLPMFTSCCPAWVKYCEQFYPTLLDNISTCKSPIGMMGVAVKEYFASVNDIDKENIFTVAITPCTAKKYEISRPEIIDTDLVITLREIEEYVNNNHIKYEDIKESDYDDFFKEGSGAGVIFGNTSGVMEAALRTAYYLLTGNNLDKVEFKNVRGYDSIKESTIDISGLKLNIAIINGMSNAKEILESVKNNTCKYNYVEIMNCVGGCIGGGGQPKLDILNKDEIKRKRIESLYNEDNNLKIRNSHDNPQIKKIYDDFFDRPLSSKAEQLLHTKYIDKSDLIK